MRLLWIVLFLGFGFVLNAQEISFKGATYEVKKGKIFKKQLVLILKLNKISVI